MFVCWSTGVCYHHYHRRPRLRQEVGSEQEDIKFLFVGIHECVINIIIAVVVIVKRWDLNRRRFFLSVGPQLCVITIIIAVLVFVKRSV